MGGEIHVSSEVGKGTEIIVSLHQKLSEKPEKDAEAVSLEEAKKTFYGRRLLIVEDNDLNREIEAAILEDAGFLVEEAVNGQEAVDKKLVNMHWEKEKDYVFRKWKSKI